MGCTSLNIYCFTISRFNYLCIYEPRGSWNCNFFGMVNKVNCLQILRTYTNTNPGRYHSPCTRAFRHVLISNCVSVIPVLYIKLNTDWHLFISEDTVRILQLPFNLFFLKKPCYRKRSDLETLHQPMSPQTKKVGATPPTHPSPFWKAYKWTQENNNFFLLCT